MLVFRTNGSSAIDTQSTDADTCWAFTTLRIVHLKFANGIEAVTRKRWPLAPWYGSVLLVFPPTNWKPTVRPLVLVRPADLRKFWTVEKTLGEPELTFTSV